MKRENVKTLDDLRKCIDEEGLRCRWCDALLTSARLKSHQHPRGLLLADASGPRWYFVSCECGYDWSVFKLFAMIARKHAAEVRLRTRLRYRLGSEVGE